MHLAHSVHFSTASHPSANRHGTVRSAPYCNKYSAVTMARQRQQLQPGKRPRGRLQGLLEARCSAPPTPCRPLAVPPLSVLTVCAAPRAASSASRNRRSWSRSPSSAISSTSSQWMRCRRGPGGGGGSACSRASAARAQQHACTAHTVPPGATQPGLRPVLRRQHRACGRSPGRPAGAPGWGGPCAGRRGSRRGGRRLRGGKARGRKVRVAQPCTCHLLCWHPRRGSAAHPLVPESPSTRGLPRKLYITQARGAGSLPGSPQAITAGFIHE